MKQKLWQKPKPQFSKNQKLAVAGLGLISIAYLAYKAYQTDVFEEKVNELRKYFSNLFTSKKPE